MSWQKKREEKNSTKISSGEIIVFKFNKFFNSQQRKIRDFRDSHQNKWNVQMNVKESE